MAEVEAGSTWVIGVSSGGEPVPLCAVREVERDGKLVDFPDGVGWARRARRPSNGLIRSKPRILSADHY